MAHTLALLGFDPREPWVAFTRSSELVYLPYLVPGLALIGIARMRTKASDRRKIGRRGCPNRDGGSVGCGHVCDCLVDGRPKISRWLRHGSLLEVMRVSGNLCQRQPDADRALR